MIKPEAQASSGVRWQPTELVRALLSRGARDVVQHWISQKCFLDSDNQPRSLVVGTQEETGFNSLISQVSPHLVPSVVCNELLRKGIVEQHDNGCLMLRRSAYVPGTAGAEQPFLIADDRFVSGENRRRRRNDFI